MAAPRLVALAAFSILTVGCGDDTTTTGATAPDASTTTPPREGFCATRPKLAFCADFDDVALPAPFAELAPAAITPLAIEDREAPTAPKVASFRATTPDAEAFLWTPRIAKAARWNALLFVKVEARTSDVVVARIDGAPGPSLAIVVAPDGAVRIEETDAAGASVSHATPIRVTDGAWSSVRWDVRDDGTRSTVRLRFGDEMSIEDAPLTYRHGDLTPRLGIGLASRAPTAVAFDTVTFAGGETE